MADPQGKVDAKPFLRSRWLPLGLVVTLIGVLAFLYLHQTRQTVLAIEGRTMGSGWSARIVGPAGTDLAALRVSLEQQLVELDLALSGYRDDSALSRLNHAPVGQWVDIPPHLSRVLAFGLQLWRDSGGAFDMTVRPLVSLWGFGAAERRESLPTEAEIVAARAQLGSDRLELSPDGRQARRLSAISLDVDGIAPGYAAGVLSGWLSGHGFPAHLVEVGGEMRASGRRPDGSGWRVGIEAPEFARGQVARVVEVSDTAVTTAGDYRDYFEVDGKRYQHILDPATGRPVDHGLASVTVLAPGLPSADGYATAIMVMGPQKGLAWADAHGFAVFMILRDDDGSFSERYNQAFALHLSD